MRTTLGLRDHVEFYTCRVSEQTSVSPFDHFRDLTLEGLRVFVAVVQSGSLRSASEQLHLSQPTVGRTVNALEAQLGVALLERGPRGTRVTSEGEMLATSARRLLRAAGDLRRDVRGGGTELRLGATATSANAFLAPFLAEWLPANPGVRVTAVEDGEQRLSRKVDDGDCDVAIVSTPLPAKLNSLRLATVDVIAVLPASHPGRRSAEPVTTLELAEQPLLVNGMAYPSTRLLVHAMEAAGVVPRIVYESGVGRTLASMAEAGLGVAVFGATADLRGTDACTRRVITDSGERLAFDLHVAWSRHRKDPLPREFAIGLATGHNPRAAT